MGSLFLLVQLLTNLSTVKEKIRLYPFCSDVYLERVVIFARRRRLCISIPRVF